MSRYRRVQQGLFSKIPVKRVILRCQICRQDQSSLVGQESPHYERKKSQ